MSAVGISVTTAGVKRKASTVLETPADSTEDVFTSSSRNSTGRRNSTGKVSKNNILLASLLATRASAEQPVVNTLSIGSIATVTPQISLLKRAPASQLTSFVSGDVAALQSTARRSSSSSLSSVTSVSTAGDLVTSLSSSSMQIAPHIYRSYSHNGSRAGANPILTEANLPYQDSSMDMKTDQDLLPADVLESLCGATTVTSTPLSLMDDTTLMNQLEQFFSSSPGGMLTELENLIGDSSCPDLTSVLFGSDQASLGGNQVAATSIDDQMAKTESQSLGSHARQVVASRARGSGLLGQLLGGSMADHGTTDSSFTATAAMASDIVPQRPSSLAVSSTYVNRGM